MSKLSEIDARIAGMTEGSRVRVCRLLEPQCPETLGVGAEGTVKRFEHGRAVLEMYHGGELSYLLGELEVIGSKS